MQANSSKKADIVVLGIHKMVGGLIKASVSQFDFVQTVHVFNQPSFFFDYLKDNNVDILIVDFLMPEMNGIEIIKKCRENYCPDKLKIILISSMLEHSVLYDAIRFQANACLTNNDASFEIFNALNHIKEGHQKPYYGADAKEIMQYSLYSEEESIRFSPREGQLLDLICDSKTSKEIAFELELSLNTIHFYTRRLMKKMEVNRTPDLILKALNQGYVSRKTKIRF